MAFTQNEIHNLTMCLLSIQVHHGALFPTCCFERSCHGVNSILRQQFFARNTDPCEAKNGINRTSLSWKGRSTPSQ